MKEAWEEIADWPEYLVSDQGNVYSVRFDRVLLPGLAGKGYPFVVLSARGLRQQRYVHTLVAEAFLGPAPEPGMEPNHINLCKTDNRADNLEWTTHNDNMRHAQRLGRFANNGRARTPIRVVGTNLVFDSQADCAKALGIRQSAIANVLSGLRRSHKGYRFEYLGV